MCVSSGRRNVERNHGEVPVSPPGFLLLFSDDFVDILLDYWYDIILKHNRQLERPT